MKKQEKNQVIKGYINALHEYRWPISQARDAVYTLCMSLDLKGKTAEAWDKTVKVKWGLK